MVCGPSASKWSGRQMYLPRLSPLPAVGTKSSSPVRSQAGLSSKTSCCSKFPPRSSIPRLSTARQASKSPHLQSCITNPTLSQRLSLSSSKSTIFVCAKKATLQHGDRFCGQPGQNATVGIGSLAKIAQHAERRLGSRLEELLCSKQVKMLCLECAHWPILRNAQNGQLGGRPFSLQGPVKPLYFEMPTGRHGGLGAVCKDGAHSVN